MNNTVIAFDGHDGAGKTTLAKSVTEKLGGIYICPFKDDFGLRLIEAADQKNFKKTFEIGEEAIMHHLKQYQNQLLIFDRHWMTVFSLLPFEHRKKWKHFPKTILCHANLNVTKERLNTRKEKKYDDSYHQYYIGKYLELGKEYKSHIINTENKTTGQTLENALQWINKETGL